MDRPRHLPQRACAPTCSARACRRGRLRSALLCAVLAAAPACAWVKLDKQGARVELREAAQVAATCQKIGMVSARTLRRVVFRRSDERMARELAILARNEAGHLGGDTIAASSPVAEGRQSFDVYRCSIT